MFKFLKSLVLPRSMARHRNMSALFSVCIVVLTCYLFSLPVGNYYLDNKGIFLTFEEDYMVALTGVDESNQKANEIAEKIKNCGLTYDSTGNLILKEELGSDYKYIDQFTFSHTFEKKDEDGNPINENVNFVVHLGVYFDTDSDEDGPDELVSFEDSQMHLDFNNIPVVEGEKQVLVVFTKNAIVYQVGQNKEVTEETTELEKSVYESSTSLYIPLQTQILFTSLMFNPLNLGETGHSLLMEVATILSYNYASTNYMMYVLFSIIPSCILFPLIISLLFWLCFKKNGQIKRFKEYFNVCAISTIIPAILCFIVAWFYVYIVEYYVFIFSLYFLFVIFRINTDKQFA